jgi:hypothetical protein
MVQTTNRDALTPVCPSSPLTRSGSSGRSRWTAALVAAAVTVLGACSGSSTSPSPTAAASTTATSTTSRQDAVAWQQIDQGVAAIAPDVGLLAARVTADGTCHPIHQIASSTPRPTGSQFKLIVLGALADQIAAGTVSWDQRLSVADAKKSVGNSEASGSLQFAKPGERFTVREAATKMISISDNTAADLLIDLVGRDAVTRQGHTWIADQRANDPFLTTREMLLLHYAKGLGDRYLAEPQDQRASFLARSVDPRPISDIGTAYSNDPRFIDQIEWFASPRDICKAFAGLQQLAKKAALSGDLPKVLSKETVGIGLEPSVWPEVWYKGGSESGVLTLGWLATDRRGRSFVVEAMVSNPDAALATDSITDLIALSRTAFGLLEAG